MSTVVISCSTEGCPLHGKEINRVTGVDDLDLFFEAHDEGDQQDVCIGCNILGTAEEA